MSMSQRKSDHIQINLQKDVLSGVRTGLERYHFIHQALPDMDLKDVDTTTEFLGKTLKIPLLISSMTGGTPDAQKINETLARTAERFGLATGLGSIRIGLENPDLFPTFQVRKYAPSIPLYSNLGAVQLNYGYGIEECRKAVDVVGADGLILHLNCLQEALQPEGNTNFSGLLKKIEKICHQLPVPVIVKEIGWGISGRTARQLISAGVSALDTAGAGGTSWSEVEKYRAGDSVQFETAVAFKDWGIPLVESLVDIRESKKTIALVASGGIRNGVDMAKCLVLGADLCGIAGMFLKAAANSQEEAFNFTETVIRQLRVTMFAAGASDIRSLKKLELRANYP